MSIETLKPKRPVNLDLMTIKQPITAIVSICHRISGILIFLLMPVILYTLQKSLESSEDFSRVHDCFEQGPLKIVLWVFFSALLYHVLAGIRHLLMDCGLGEHVSTARKSAGLLVVLSVIGFIWLGVSLW